MEVERLLRNQLQQHLLQAAGEAAAGATERGQGAERPREEATGFCLGRKKERLGLRLSRY